MAKAPVRQNDEVSNTVHGKGHITTGDPTVTFEGQPVACVGDTAKFADTLEGVIQEGNACVVVNDKRIALVGDNTDKDGEIATGASTIQVDEGKPFVYIGPNVSIGKNVMFSCKPAPTYNQHFMLYHDGTGEPLPYTPYRIKTQKGVIEGITDDNGCTSIVDSSSAETISLEISGEE